MATLEQVEKLRERANVTYDEAKAALEATGDDMLDALIYLEKQGKVSTPDSGGGYYSSEKSSGGEGTNTQTTANGGTSYSAGPKAGKDFVGFLKEIGRFLLKLIRKGNENFFEAYKDNENKFSLPVTVLVVLLIFTFWVTLPLLVIGLFAGFRYRFHGPDLGKQSVNDMMDSAADTVDSVKKSINEEK